MSQTFVFQFCQVASHTCTASHQATKKPPRFGEGLQLVMVVIHKTLSVFSG